MVFILCYPLHAQTIARPFQPCSQAVCVYYVYTQPKQHYSAVIVPSQLMGSTRWLLIIILLYRCGCVHGVFPSLGRLDMHCYILIYTNIHSNTLAQMHINQMQSIIHFAACFFFFEQFVLVNFVMEVCTLVGVVFGFDRFSSFHSIDGNIIIVYQKKLEKRMEIE